MNREISIGQVIFTSFKPLTKMMMIAGVGAFLAHKGILDPRTCRANAFITINVLLPLLIFNSTVSSFSSSNINEAAVVVLCSIVFQAFGLATGLIVRSFTPIPRSWRNGVIACGAFSNVGDLVIAYLGTLAMSKPFNGQRDADKGIAYASVFMAVQAFTVYNLGGFRLVKRDFDQVSHRDVEGSRTRTRALGHNLLSLVSIIGKCKFSKQSNDVTTSGKLKTEGTSAQDAPTTEQESSQGQPALPASPLPARFAVRRLTKKHNANHTTGLREQPAAIELGNNTSNSARSQTPPRPQTRRQRFWTAAKVYINPPSVSLLIAIIVAMVSPVRALFVHTDSIDIGNAPDQRPALDFIISAASFGGAASPVMGLLLLGAALKSLKIHHLPPGFWWSVLTMAMLKLVLGPIIGIVMVTQLRKTPLIDLNSESAKMLQFAIIITSGMPSASTQIYLTQLFAPEESPEMSALSAVLLAQYVAMVFTLSAVATYTLLVIL